MFLLYNLSATAQVSDYNFAVQSGTYVEISQGTLFVTTGGADMLANNGTPSLDSFVSNQFTIPPFNYAGTVYTDIRVTSNGQLVLGTTGTVPSSNYRAISTSFGNNIVLSPFGADLNVGANGLSDIRYQTIGDETIVQWRNFRRYGLAEGFSFQVRLNNVTGVIKFVYSGTPPYATSTSYQPQIGIKSEAGVYRYIILGTGNSWINATSSVTGVSDSSTCRFSGTDGFINGLTFIFTPPACSSPTALTVSNITLNSGVIGWTSTGTSFDIKWGISGFNVETEGTLVTGFTNGGMLSGLQPSTSYQFYVRQNCGVTDGVSRWAGPFSFRTNQIPATLPYTEGFEDTINWDLVNGAQINKWFVGTATQNGGTKGLYISNNATGTTNVYGHTISTVHAYRDVLIPDDANALNLSFDWKAAGESCCDYIRVWVVPTTYTPTASEQTTTTNSNGIQLFEKLNLSSTFTRSNIEIDASAYQGQTVRLIFEWKNDGSGGTTSPAGAIDNVSISVVDCPMPTALTATNILPNSAVLGWTSMGNLFDVEIMLATATATGTPTNTGVPNSLAVTNLLEATAYKFYVRQDCGAGEVSQWSGPFSFTTACDLPSTPTTITFTSVSATATTVNYISPDSAPSGYLIFRSTSNVPPVLVNGTSYTANQTTAVASLTSGDNTYFCVYKGTSLSGAATSLTSNTRYYYYVYAQNSGNSCFGAPWYAQEVLTGNQVTAPAAPTVPSASNISINGATVSWTASVTGGSAGIISYILEVYTDSGYTNQVSGSPFNVGTDLTYDLVGLNASTQYYYRIKANNTFADSSYVTGSFVTLCVPVVNLPYIENFDVYGTGSNAFPVCWTRPVTYLSSSTTYPSIVSYSSTPSSPNNLRFQSAVGTPTYAVTPAFAEDLHNLRVIFQLKREGTQSGNIDIGVMSDPSDIATFEVVETINPDNNNFNEYIFYLNETVLSGANKHIAFRHNSGSSSWYYWLDDFVVELIPACLEPTDLSVSEITQNSANLGWISTGTLFDIKWGVLDFDVETEGTLVEGFANGGTLSGLASQTNYQFYVRQDCEAQGGVSAWTGPFSFLTLCGPVDDLPYIENFDTYGTGSNAFPLCWERPVTYTASSTVYPSIVAEYPISSSNSLKFRSEPAAPTYAISPAFTEDIHNLRTKFHLKREGASSGTIEVGVMSDPSNLNTFEVVEIINPSDDNHHEYTVYFNATTLSGANRYIAFRHKSTRDNWFYWLDNVIVELIPSCYVPENVQITSITKNTATILWDVPEVLPATGYEYEIRTSGNPGSGATGFIQSNTTTVGVNTADIVNLLPDTTYSVYVRSVCIADDVSVWTLVKNFTTLCNYPDIVSVTPTTICGVGSGVISADFSDNTNVNWYAAATGGQSLFTGTSFNTPELNTDTTYYVDATAQPPYSRVQVGQGTTTSATYSNPFYSAWSNSHTQYLIKAEELLSAGLIAGNIYSVALDVTSAGTLPMKELSVKIGATTASTMSQFVANTNFNTVYTNASLMPTAGLNILNFTTPYVWDGTSNIVLEFCHGNSSSTTTMSRTVKTDPTSYVSVIKTHRASSTAGNVICSDTTTNSDTYSVRPVFVFNAKEACVSPRVPVQVTLTEAPELVLSIDEIEVCAGSSSDVITIVNGADDYDTFVWTPSEGVVDNGTGWVITPLTNQVYTLRASQSNGVGCVAEASVNVKAVALPSEITITPSSETTCNGEVVGLEATGGIVGGDFIIGTGTNLTSATSTGPASFNNRHSSSRTQTIYTATELITAGVQAGPINSLAYNITTNGDATTNSNYTVKIAHVAESAFANTSFYNNINFTTVYGPSTYTHDATLGWNTITFTTPFIWDGVSNIVIDVFMNGANSLNNARTYYTTSTNAALANYAVTATVATGTRSNEKLNIKLNTSSPTNITWSPLANLYENQAATVVYTGDARSKVYFKPIEEGDFIVTAVATRSGASACSVAKDITLHSNFVSNPIAVPQQFCNAVSVDSITVSVDSDALVNWYASETSTTALTSIEQTGTYFVQASKDNCKSGRVSVQITIIGDLIPIVSRTQSFCDFAIISNLTVTTSHPDGIIQWFDSAVSTTPLSSSTELVSGVYYVSQLVSGCTSARVPVQVEVIATPDPISVNSVSVCYGTTIGQVVIDGRTNLKWFANQNSTTALTSGTIVTNGRYYIATYNGICVAPKTMVEVNVVQQLNQVSTSLINICGSGIVSDLDRHVSGMVSNAQLRWFSSINATTPLSGTTILSNGTYYVEQFLTGCSGPRKGVAVRVTDVSAPQSTEFEFCGNAKISDVIMPPVASGVTYNWYLPNTTTPLVETTALQTGNYFVSKSLNSCESAKVIVSVIIKPRPAGPTGNISQNFIDSAIIADLEMNESNVIWYISQDDALNNRNPLQNNMPLTNAQVYYAVVVGPNGCASLPTAVTVTITLGVKDLDLASLKYYPNPADSELTVSYKEPIRSIEIYDILGKQIKVQKFETNEVRLDVSRLSSGTYMLKVQTDSGSQFVKIVKK